MAAGRGTNPVNLNITLAELMKVPKSPAGPVTKMVITLRPDGSAIARIDSSSPGNAETITMLHLDKVD